MKGKKSWTATPLGTIVDEVKESNTDNGSRVLTLSNEEGLIYQSEYFGKRVASKETTRYTPIRRNDFVYNDRSTIKSPFGTIKMLSKCDGGIVSPIYLVFRPKNVIAPEFLKWYFESGCHSSAMSSIVDQGARIGRFNLTAEKFFSISVYLPEKEEQQKIADCLSSLDELIAVHAKKLEGITAFKNGLMQRLFPAEGEKLPRLRFAEFKGGVEWEERKLGDLATIVRGGSPRPIEEYLTDDLFGLNWLKIGDVDQSSKYVIKTREKVHSSALAKTREVLPGDLILSNSMSFGRPYISKIKTCIHDGWIAVSQISKMADIEFIYYNTLSSASQTYFERNAAGAVVQNLNAEIIKLLPVWIPTVREQQEISSCLSSLDELIAAEAGKLEALRTHKKALMQALFPQAEEEA